MTSNKKGYLQTVVTSMFIRLLDSFKKEKNEIISEQTNKQTKYVSNLTNEEFRELIVGERQQLVSLRNR
jgi:hypothetical protein